jgi:hypothetical protein
MKHCIYCITFIINVFYISLKDHPIQIEITECRNHLYRRLHNNLITVIQSPHLKMKGINEAVVRQIIRGTKYLIYKVRTV